MKLQRNEPQFSFASEEFTFGGSSSSLDFSRESYRISPPIDQIYKPNYDLDTKWRSVAVSNQIPNHFMAASASNQFIAAHEPKKDIAIVTAPSSSQSQPKLPGDYKAPKQPLLLMTTHFITCVPISCIITLVERALLHFSELSFSMVADNCMVSTHLFNFFSVFVSCIVYYLICHVFFYYFLWFLFVGIHSKNPVECRIFTWICTLQYANSCIFTCGRTHCRSQ